MRYSRRAAADKAARDLSLKHQNMVFKVVQRVNVEMTEPEEDSLWDLGIYIFYIGEPEHTGTWTADRVVTTWWNGLRTNT